MNPDVTLKVCRVGLRVTDVFLSLPFALVYLIASVICWRNGLVGLGSHPTFFIWWGAFFAGVNAWHVAQRMP